jgi:hypothetical protein
VILNRVTTEVVAHGRDVSGDTEMAFWIRLCQMLLELGAKYEFLGELLGPQPHNAMCRDTLAVRDAIRAVRDALDEDERIYLQYRRDTMCHIWQDSYELNARNGKLKEQRSFSLIGQPLHVDEFDRRVRAFLLKHGVDETRIAVEFARRLAPLIGRLLASMLPLY